MKKRILAFVILAIIAVSSFTMISCKEKTTYEIVSEAITKTLSLESVDLDFDEVAKTTTNIAGRSVAVTVESNNEMQIEGFNSENSKFNVSSVTTVSDQSLLTETYYDGEYYYVRESGKRLKIEKDNEEAELLNSVDNIKTLIVQIPEELLSEAVLTVDEENKTKSLEIEIEDDKFKELFQEYIDLQKSALDKQYDGSYGDIVFVNVINGKISLLINEEGYLENYTVSCKMIFRLYYSVGKTDYTARISVEDEAIFGFNNQGEKVTVTPPKEIDKYKLQEI